MGELFNPKTIPEVNYFAFETQTRGKMKQLIQPLFDLQVHDRQSLDEIKRQFSLYDKRLAFVEGIFEGHKGKNVIFDEMQEKLVNFEVERVKFVSKINGMVETLKERQANVLVTMDAIKLQSDNNKELLLKLNEQQLSDTRAQQAVN